MKHNPTLAIRSKRERASRLRKPPRKPTQIERALARLLGVQRGISHTLSLIAREAPRIERRAELIDLHILAVCRSIHGVETAIRDAAKLYDDSQAFPDGFGIDKDDGDDP